MRPVIASSSFTPTVPAEEAENVRPRDRLRRGPLAPGTQAGIGPRYDARPEGCGFLAQGQKLKEPVGAAGPPRHAITLYFNFTLRHIGRQPAVEDGRQVVR